MKRELNMNEVSDGKKYNSNDMVKLGSNECEGCFSCCQGMEDTIILDPYDIYRLVKNLNLSFEVLLGKSIELGLVDGVILPHLKMSGTSSKCVFLNDEGRCSVHSFRPAFCRLFPLGRIYENGSFAYFLQVNECVKTNRTKVKISKWLEEADLKKYEKFVNDWHDLLIVLGNAIQNSDNDDFIKSVNMNMIKNFYMHPYETGEDFFEQFYSILAKAHALIDKKKEEMKS